MAEHEAIKLFESLRVRIVRDDVEEKYYFSVVDVVSVLTESADGRKYWNKLKQRLVEEGNQTVTNCHQLKLTAADGKRYLTDVADSEQILRIIQSIPSKKAAFGVFKGEAVYQTVQRAKRGRAIRLP